MASPRLILQGFTSDTHLTGIIEVLDAPDLERAILSIAYVSEAGVKLLAAKLQPLAEKVVVFAGIRNEITSRQALAGLLDVGVKVVAVDTGSTHLAYHPKLYYARGAQQARLLAGSANLTTGGLNNNVEASLLLTLDLSDLEDRQLAHKVELEFDELTNCFPEHVVPVTTVDDLLALQDAGRLIGELEASRPRVTRLGGRQENDLVPLIKLKVQPLHVAVPPRSLEDAPAGVEEPPPPVFGAPPQTAEIATSDYELMWESKPLTERDLTIPRGERTNQTGSMNLDKGLLPEGVDHRHYFRDRVFDRLRWQPRSETVDEAVGTFQAILKGNPIGVFHLPIRHTTSTDTRSYEQRNAMTRLGWGELRPHILSRDLLDRTARIYRSITDPTAFLIEID